MPIRMVGKRPIATLGLNGTQVPMMLDSGAFFSFLDASTAKQLELPVLRWPEGLFIEGVAGEVDAYLTRVEKVQFLKGEMARVEFVVDERGAYGSAQGLLGRNLLATASDTEFDLANGIVRLVEPSVDCAGGNLAYWAAGMPVNVVPLLRNPNERDWATRVAVRVNGKDMTALLDTGASETFIRLNSAKGAGIVVPTAEPGQRVAGAGAGSVPTWSAKVDSFELGGERITHNVLEVGDSDSVQDDVILGVDYFLSHRIYVARSQKRMYVTYNGGQVFGRNVVDKAGGPADAASAARPDGPADADALARRAAASAARGDFASALADYDRACALDPRSARCFAERAAVHQSLEQPDAAAKDFDQALRLEPAATDTRLKRATLRVTSGDREGALQDLAALDAAMPPEANLRRPMADAYVKLEMPAQALHQWALWVQAHPGHAHLDGVLNSRCWTRVRFDIELDQALDDCRRAVDMSSSNAAFRDSLAWVHLRRGEYRKAVEEFDRSLALRPPTAAAGAGSVYGRGIARLRLGEKAKSDADFEAARKLDAAIDDEMRQQGLAVDQVTAGLAGPNRADAAR
jgi:tetratricopeptide (TPR) repeat protein/predicted aspartyl protease